MMVTDQTNRRDDMDARAPQISAETIARRANATRRVKCRLTLNYYRHNGIVISAEERGALEDGDYATAKELHKRATLDSPE